MKSSKIRNLYDYEDVARILDRTYITVARLGRQGKLKSFKISGKYYVKKNDLDIYMNKGGVFNRPKAEIINIIKEGLQVANEGNMVKIEYMIKEMLCEILEKNIKINLEKIDKNNRQLKKVLPKESMKHLEDRESILKKELQGV